MPTSTVLIYNLRYFDLKLRDETLEKIQRSNEALELQYNGVISVEMRNDQGPLPVYNNPELTERARKYATELIGLDNVLEADLRMGGDDFSHYSNLIPGLIFRLGTSNEALGISAGLHKENFTVDEQSFDTGIAVMLYTILKELGVE